MQTGVFTLLAILCISAKAFAFADSVRHDGSVVHIASPAEDADDAATADADVAERDMLRHHPVNLNTADMEDLLAIPSMTPALARAIIASRDSTGGFNTVSELRRVAGIGRDRYASFAAYLVVSPLETAVPAAFTLRSRVSEGIEPAAGFTNGAYPGSRPHVYNRLDMKSGAWQSTIVEEKDAGESSVFDHLSASLMYSATTWKIIAGDYDAGAGQGLFLWRGMATGKSSEVIRAPLRASFGVTPARSATEFGTLRGLAANLNSDMFSCGVLLSNVSRDASLNDDGSFSALGTSGLHRTTAEQASHNTVRERLIGGQAGVRWNGGLLSATATSTTLDHPWAHGGMNLTLINNAGISCRQDVGKTSVFGECAADFHGDIAAEGGGVTRISDELEGSILYRRYPHYFFALHANAFGEHTTAENEEGMYVGCRWTMNEVIVISAYRDMFAFPFPTNTIPLPSSGNESFILVDAALSKDVHCRALYSQKNSPGMISDTTAAGDVLQHEENTWRRRERAEVQYDNDVVGVRGRMELVQFRRSMAAPVATGMLIFADASIAPFAELKVSARIVFFNTLNFDARVYEFEAGLNGTSSTPALYGAGGRSYIYVSYRPFPSLIIECKWQETFKPHEASFGSGDALIMGDAVHVLEAQVTWKF